MATIKKKTLTEKIQEADLSKITIKKGVQDFLFLWQEQEEIIRKLEKTLNEKFGIMGKPKTLTLACKYLLNEIESEAGTEENDGK